MEENKNLQKLLSELNLSQSEMAEILGISRQQFNNIINSRNTFTQKNLEILHDKFNINLNWLLYNEGAMLIDPKERAEVIKIRLKKGQILEIEYEE